MKLFAQISVFLTAFLGLIVWIAISFWPQVTFSFFGISAINVLAINTLKSDIGGCFLSLAVFGVLYFIKGKFWLLPLIVVLASVLFSRVISSLIDGFTAISMWAMFLEAFAIIIFMLLLKAKDSK